MNFTTHLNEIKLLGPLFTREFAYEGQKLGKIR